jgi:uncharacterized protein YfaS (alpha-2-macroglobulin family)
MRRIHQPISLLLLISLLFSSLTPVNTAAKSRVTNAKQTEENDEKEGLQFRLSEAPDQPEAQPGSKLAAATVLSDIETENILKRLAPIKAEGEDEKDFALRERSLPPPRTGQTISVSFPATANSAPPEITATGPLEVVRYSPEGAVPLAPSLSITFSQAMIALSSQEEAAENVPVTLSPQPSGKWRWVGTKTLLFEPVGRFPMATQYSATVPAGTKSANGGALAMGKTWSFVTPPPTIKRTYPEKNVTEARDPIVFIEFDQRIDPATVLKTINVSADDAKVPTRLATKEEVEEDEDVLKLSKEAGKDTWLAFRPLNPKTGDTKFALPADVAITISVEPGTRSAEGPLATKEPQQFSFHTYGPLRLEASRCAYRPTHECTPYDSWQLEFSNSIRGDKFTESQLRIEPKIENLSTSINGGAITIEGSKKPNTTYRVTVDKSLRDYFDQTLAHDETVEFKVGSLPSLIKLSAEDFVVLDPAGPRRLVLYSQNFQTVNVSLYAVEPKDWILFDIYRQLHYRYRGTAVGDKAVLPGRVVYSKRIELKNSPNELIETPIDLMPGLTNGVGQVLVVVDTITPVADANRNPQLAWVQVTKIGLDAFVDNDELVGWASSLDNGAPLRGVALQIAPAGTTAVTGVDGLARLNLTSVPESRAGLLVARLGNDVAILPENSDRWGATDSSWYKTPIKDSLRWYVFDDRKLYRPGEEVHVKGWIRRVGGGKGGDLSLGNSSIKRISYSVTDREENEVAKGSFALNLLGGFDLAFTLPKTMNLGTGDLKFTADGDKGLENLEFEHGFRVEEFRRPEFEVSAKNESAGPFFVRGGGDVSVSANYFSGGGLGNTEVKWSVRATPMNYSPPNRGDFTFGKWIPWWRGDRSGTDDQTREFTGRTDASGKHRLHIDFDKVTPPRASFVVAEASVTDVNRQEWTSRTSMLVHPADLYVGLRSDKTFVQQGDPLIVQSIATDLDGKAIAGQKIEMRAERLEWKQEKGEWKEVAVDSRGCQIQSGDDAVKCTFPTKEGGTYRVTATVHDSSGRPNESELTLWVAGGKQLQHGDVDADKVELIPDRKEYKAGETAELLVQAPFYPAEGVLTLRRSGIVKTESFHVTGSTYTLRVPIDEAWTPNIHAQVDLVGATPREVQSPKSNVQSQDGSGGRGTLDIGHGTNLRPAFASGEINLSIPPISRRLNVTATPRVKTLEPGGKTAVDLEMKDAAGKPVSGGEFAVVVVDESVLALTNYTLYDPVSSFYLQREGGVKDYHSRKNLLLLNLQELMFEKEQFITEYWRRGEVGDFSINASSSQISERQISDLPIAGRNFGAEYGRSKGGIINVITKSGTNEREQPIKMRDNFNALAVFAPSVRTDANGRAQVQVTLPDNLTRYRVMAVAVADGKQFGTGESAITARLPLMARPSAPRFLNFGDHFELPIVIQNQSDSAITVDLAVRAGNASVSSSKFQVSSQRSGSNEPETRNLKLETITGRRVTVPANDRVEVRVPASTLKAGTARFQIAAISGKWSDAAEIELPVWTPATTEAFATYGEIDNGAITQPVKAPANVYKQFGGLEIETSSTQLQQLTDAFLYLQSYPYECSEQLSSRIISVAALRDVLTAFKVKGLPTAPKIEAAVVRDLKRLRGMQNEDGGFGFWQRGDLSWPYLSIHVAHALARAKQKKFDVPKEMFEQSQKYLREIETHIPSTYGADTRQAIIAYALYVRAQMDDRDRARARKLIAEAGLENLSLESVGWLLSVLSNDKNSVSEVSAIRHLLNNRVTETAGTAHFVCSYQDGDYLLLNSDRRADGVILESLIADQPSSDLIPKIVRGLLANRTRGRWGNTQENVFILLALDRYFNTYEKATPNFVARVWLGNAYAGEQQFKGRSTDRQQVNVPMSYLVDKDKGANKDTGSQVGSGQDLILSKEGPGRLYYRIGMNYAPLDLNLKPADYGFTVARSYEALDHAEDVRKDADGTWHVKAGARVRVRLTMVAPARRYHVALVDPMPAGFESLNPELATSETIPEDKQETAVSEYGNRSYGVSAWWAWRAVWFDHQNLRDERSEAFTSLLWEGVYNYSYVARATTPGQFVVPPSKAEEMYHPETFGRGKTDRIVIE